VSGSTYYAWLSVDNVPVRSSLVRIGEDFDVPGVDTFSATHFSQKVLHGVTDAPVAAGTHAVRARFACLTGASGTSSQSSHFSLIATVLSSAPTVAALNQSLAVPADAPTMCITYEDGTEECRPG